MKMPKLDLPETISEAARTDILSNIDDIQCQARSMLLENRDFTIQELIELCSEISGLVDQIVAIAAYNDPKAKPDLETRRLI